MSQLSLANVINISVAAAQRGIGNYNNSNIALFTHETPLSYGADAFRLYLTASDVAADFAANSTTVKLAQTIFSQSPNILTGGGYLCVIPLVGGTEALDTAITRTSGLVQYFGILTDVVANSTTVNAVAAQVQAMNKMVFFGQKDATTVTPTTGLASTIAAANYYKTRMLLYVGNSVDYDAYNMAAAYASRALSTDFSGSNTTQTMHMKDLTGIVADTAMTQTILNNCITAGADNYSSFQGVPKTFCTSGNKFFDDVYNQCWFTGALEVAGFNYLATTSSKIPQSEQGISGLKGAYRQVLEQGLSNQYLAPGSWTSPDTFGNLADFERNILERGYYIYSLPVNSQSPTDRAARKSPLIQISAKCAGAVHSSSVIIYVNA